jgi:hypothetical protein
MTARFALAVHSHCQLQLVVVGELDTDTAREM